LRHFYRISGCTFLFRIASPPCGEKEGGVGSIENRGS
jgi:hypothetical protein